MELLGVALLLAFNALIWLLIIPRARTLFRHLERDVLIYFALGLTLEGAYTTLLFATPLFQPYMPLRGPNTIAIVAAVSGSHFLYRFATSLLEFALSHDKVQKAHYSSLNETRHVETLFFFFALVIAIVLEFYVAGNVNDSLTRRSVDLKESSPLLASRIITTAYMLFANLLTGISLYRLSLTNYGLRLNIRIRTWAAIAGDVIISYHHVLTLTATLIIFIFGIESSVGRDTAAIFRTIENYQLYPLAACIVLGAGPKSLIESVGQIVSNLSYWMRLRRIRWLRDVLVGQFPTIGLDDHSHPMLPKPGSSSLNYEIIRCIIECSDAVHQLLGYLPASEYERITLDAVAEGKDDYEMEATLIMAALARKKAGAGVTTQTRHQALKLPSLTANSISELVDCYFRLSKYVQQYME